MAKQRIEKGRSLIAAVPWWGWLAMALAVWFLARLIVGLSPPPKATPAHVVSVSLLKAIGYFLSLVGPLVLAFLAAASAVMGAKAETAQELPRSEPVFGNAPVSESREGSDLYGVWKQVGEPPSPPEIDITTWNLPLLKALEWKRLEQLSAVYFRTLKFRVEEAAPGADGGVDLHLYSAKATRPEVLVQCKAWNSWKVGVKEIRELFGVMAADCVDEGIFVTTSTFSKDAIEFARGKNIALVDGDDLLDKLRSLPAADQAHILKLVTAGDFTTPTCPSCGIKMVKRDGRESRPFWGCVRFPSCRTVLGITAAARSLPPLD